MYPLLRHGDRLPTVAAVQVLTNRKLEQGSFIAVDGIYGSQTRDAVKGFQRRRGLSDDGVVGKNTWEELIRGEGLQVIDSVDVTNHDDMGYEDAAIEGAGGRPVVNFGLCNGVRDATGRIQSRGGNRSVVLLRFHGHGAPGVMGISTGTGAEISSEFGVEGLEGLARYLSRLAPMFAPFGSAELHGCRVGAGRDGRQLVSALARAWDVPVTAGLRTQYGGGSSTFRFEGPTFTSFPRAGSLKDWARTIPVPEIWGMSVAPPRRASADGSSLLSR